MTIVTFEGIVDGGQIKLKSNVRLPDNTRVFVVVPDLSSGRIEETARIYSPKLSHPAQLADFTMEIVEEPPGAKL